jgi:hypothetical protein
MFPLGTVLFPHALLPLHVFEPRYRVMIRHVLEDDQQFGVVLIERGSEVGGGDVRFDIGTLARVVHAAEVPDGRYALTAVGTQRVSVARWLPDDPYPIAEVEALTEPPSLPTDAEARDLVVARLAMVTELARQIDERVAGPPDLDLDPVRASFEAAALAPIGPLDAQRLLETDTAGTRLVMLAGMLDERADDLRARLGE